MKRLIVSIFAALVVLWSLMPVYWVFNLAFQTALQIFTLPAYLFPPTPTLENYLRALGSSLFLSALQNSMIVATLVMFATLALCIPAGYAFARFSFPARTVIFFTILFARALPPIATSIPYYQFYKEIGLLGTILGLVLAQMTLTVPLATWVLSGFFTSLPEELDKQARIDGCNRFQLLSRVIIPTAAPGLAAVAVLTWLTSWNEIIFAWLLASLRGLYTVPLAIHSTAMYSFSLVPSVIAAVILQKFMTRLRIVGPLTFRAPSSDIGRKLD